MQLVIDETKAREIYPTAAPELKTILEQSFGGKKFFLKKVTERIKTIEDVFAEVGENYHYFLSGCNEINLTKDEVAYRLIKKIVKALNQGWTPNWNDSNQRKYYPYFKLGSGFGFSDFGYGCVIVISFVGSRLVFENSELAEYAGRQFESIYKDFLNN